MSQIERPYRVDMLSPAGKRALKAWRDKCKAETPEARKEAGQRYRLAATEFTRTDSEIFSTLACGGAEP